MVRNVLVIRSGALGDTLMLTPALLHLKGAVHVTLVGRNPGLDFLRDHVDQAFNIEGQGWFRLFLQRPHERGLPVSAVDLVAAFLHDEDGSISHNLRAYFPGSRIELFPPFPHEDDKVHVAYHMCSCLRKAGLPIDPEEAFKRAFEVAILGRRPRSFFNEGGLVLHPGSGNPQKNHPPSFWLHLLRRFGEQSGLGSGRMVILLGPAEETLHSSFAGIREGPHNVEFCLFPERDALVGLLQKARVYVGHDSGITHLAAMLGVPSIALFKRTDAIRWRPLGPAVRVIEQEDPNPDLLDKILDAAKDLIAS
jgi:heptosyltransferase-3